MRIELFRVTVLINVSLWLITSGLSFAGDPAKVLQEVKPDDQKYAGTWTGTFSRDNGNSGQLKYTFIKDEKGKWSGKLNYQDQSLDFKLLEIADGKMKAKVDLRNGEVEAILEGTFVGDNLEGTFALFPNGSTEAAGKGTWKVTRTTVKKSVQGKDNSLKSSDQNVLLLDAGKSIEREIKVGDVHIYQINLRSGESVWGEVVQRDIDVTGFFPDGSKIRAYGSPQNERKTFEIVAEAPGMYRLEIKTANNGGTVVYELRTMEVLPIAERLQFVAPEKYQSPRLATLGKELLAGNNSAADNFWQEVEQRGTPLIEPIEGDDKNVLVTFLWRATFETWNVLVVWKYGIDRPDDYKMRRLANSNLWYKTLRLPRGARFYYLLSPNDRLISGGKDAQRESTAQIDPLNPRRSSDDANLSKYDMASIAELPGAHPQEWADRRPDVATGKVEKLRFKSALMKNERDIAIFTPANYQSAGTENTPYDLLVLFDGPDYQNGIPAPIILDNLIAEKRIAPLIAVLVSNPLLPGRSRELSCNPQFAEFLAKELVPWLRERYQVTRDPGHVTVGGLSLGGLAAAYVAMRNPETFGNVLAQSGSFWWSPKRNEGEEPNWLARQFIESRKLPLTFYLEAGIFENDISGNGGGILENTRHLRDVLRAKGYEVHYREFAGGHDFLSWRGSLADGLLSLARMRATR